VVTVLFFRPNKDFAMQYASNWLGRAIPEALKRGYKVIDMIDEATTLEGLENQMATEKVDVAIMGGHGNADVFTGYEQQVVFQTCSGDEVMKNTLSHFLSCSVGQRLLPDMIGKGAVWTIGYQVDFQFMVNDKYPIDADPYAEPFRDVTITIITKILDGAKLKEVWEAGIAKCDEWIAKLWNRPETDWAEVISSLQHDRDGMIGLGDKEAYVAPPRRVTAGIPQLAGLALIFLLLTGGKV
jgi:hypothetical protein